MVGNSGKIPVGEFWRLMNLPNNIFYGSHFEWGATGIASLENGEFYISQNGYKEERLQFANLKLYRFDPEHPEWFRLKNEEL